MHETNCTGLFSQSVGPYVPTGTYARARIFARAHTHTTRAAPNSAICVTRLADLHRTRRCTRTTCAFADGYIARRSVTLTCLYLPQHHRGPRKRVFLSLNEILFRCIIPRVCEESIKQLEANSAELTKLNLNNIKTMSAEVIKRLCEALTKNNQLLELHMAATAVTSAMVEPFFDMLSKNTTLKVLNLESNFLTGKRALHPLVYPQSRFSPSSTVQSACVSQFEPLHSHPTLMVDSFAVVRFNTTPNLSGPLCGSPLQVPGPRLPVSMMEHQVFVTMGFVPSAVHHKCV
ncbi:unnamed protein product [Echinostoma caproni]|uniref:Leucine-rich repeat-containing protein 20 n=1 Tax=Echinostoma caproni TaxID=27848 RepID=A0A183ABC0_9TREM|nr:unnamed protein product [Echinostoma caproni]